MGETWECPECGEPVDEGNQSDDGTRCSDCYWAEDERMTKEREQACAPGDLTPNEEEEAALRERLAELLTQTANALKGDPPPLTHHDWSDLPTVAAETKAKLEAHQKLSWDATQAADRLITGLKRTKKQLEASRDEVANGCGDPREDPYERSKHGQLGVYRQALRQLDELIADGQKLSDPPSSFAIAELKHELDTQAGEHLLVNRRDLAALLHMVEGQ
jgi:hypothetical protein